MTTQKKNTAKVVNIDAKIERAATAYAKADGQGEAAKVRAVLPLVPVTKGSGVQKQFAEALVKGGYAGSTSTVGRYFRAASWAKAHGIVAVKDASTHQNLVVAQKVKGGPATLDKITSAKDMREVSARLAKQEVTDRTGAPAARRRAVKVAESQTVAQLATMLRVRIESALKGEANSALTNHDVTAMNALLATYQRHQSVPAKPAVIARPRRKSA